MSGSRRGLAIVLLLLAAQPIAAAQDDGERTRVQQALDLLQRGDRERAEAILSEIVADNPGNGVARLQLGRLALARGDYRTAESHLSVAAESQLQRAYLAWSLLGRAQLALRQPQTARRSFEQSLATAPDFGPSLLGRARASLFLGQTEEALLDLLRALELPGATPEIALLAAQLLTYLGDATEADRLLQLILDNTEPTDPAVAAATMLRLASASGAEARRELEVRIGQNLLLADAWLALGLHRQAEGEPSAATCYRIALAVDDGNPLAWLLLQRLDPEAELPPLVGNVEGRLSTARDLAERGQIEEAGRIAQRLVAERPLHVPAVLLALRAAEARQDLWTALAGYRQIDDLVSGLPAVEARLADVAHATGADELAEASIRAAIEAFPDDGALRYRLGTVLAAIGDTEGAIAALERAIDDGYDEAAAWLVLGQQHLQRMDTAPAIAAYRRALEIDPDAAEAVGSFALSSLTGDEFAALRELLERHAAAHPDNADTQYSLGVMSLREGRPGEALPYLERAATAAPERSQVQYNLGLAYTRLGREDDARTAMERFAELKAKEDDLWNRQNRLHLLRVEAEDAAQDPERALDIRTEIAADPLASVEDRMALAQALAAAGRHIEAVEWFERVLAEAPYRAAALEGVAASAAANGDVERARAAEARANLLAPPARD